MQPEVGLDLRWNSDNKDASRNDQRQKNVSMVNGHLSFGRRKASARAVLIAFGAGEAPERRANLPRPQMTIDK